MNLKKASTQSLQSQGFTLVEMMIVVGIVGILAAVAIPNYLKYQEKARQAEAKIALAGIFIAETSFYNEQGSYTNCLSNAGYQPINSFAQYYDEGFDKTNGVGATSCGPSGTVSCSLYSFTGGLSCAVGTGGTSGPNEFPANAFTRNAFITVPAADAQLATLTTTALTQTTFLAGSVGGIGGTTWDAWTIDNNKDLSNKASGL
jgi:type IV pilus assembly protein PilA